MQRRRGDPAPPPSGQLAARKVRVLTELLIECFDGASRRDGIR